MEIARPSPVGPPASIAPALSGSAAPATELPPHKVVAQANSATDPGSTGPRPTAAGSAERRVVIDPGTQELVTQTLNADTDEIVAQTPDRAQLGRRAYIDEVTRRQDIGRAITREMGRLTALTL